MTKPDSLKETDTSHISAVRNAKDSLHARDIKEKLQSLSHCGSGYTAALSGGRKSEADLSGQPIGRNENADVANEMPVFGVGDSELHPVTDRKQPCFTHLAEKPQGLGLGHG
ncbi:MAG: hypothetical protein OEV39_00790 [Gammaproteobacteria bacterium]|nr:hypothetical protein [Gammaproteobacteria bacterium]